MRIQFSERELLDPGFRRAYQPPLKDAPPIVPAGQSRLTSLRKGDRVKARDVRVYKKTRTPVVMSEAALIQAMRAHGIGRPSTYAATIETLLGRGYVSRKPGGGLASTGRGREVCAFLVNRFPALFDYDFTARMESRLDDVAAGHLSYVEALQEFWTALSTALGEKTGR
jgi:DNA topoisomerase-1